MQINTIDGLNTVLDDIDQPGVPELCQVLAELLTEPDPGGRCLGQQRLSSRHPRVYRLHFACHGELRSLVVKRLEPAVAHRNELVINRWLPAIGLAHCGPVLLGVAADRQNRCCWHVYEDLGDWTLKADELDPARVRAAIELIAQLHTRFANHPLLPECRLQGGDAGIHFFTSSVQDAIRCLEAACPPAVPLSEEGRALRDRLLSRLQTLRDEQPGRAQALAELGGPETLLHGDLWMTNTFVLPGAHGPRARLIDWDHAAVGPASYDLSTFLLRFAPQDRENIFDLYHAAVRQAGWRLPPAEDLNPLFETAELARFANRAIWPALALLTEDAEWAFAELAEVEQWFESLEPVLSTATERRVANLAHP